MEGLTSPLTVEYLGHRIERGPDDNYRVRPPEGGWWSEIAATLGTAKKWVRLSLKERRARKARALRG